jgi:hypothetical protein
LKLEPGKLGEESIHKLLDLGDDSQSRRFIGFFDQLFGKPIDNLPPEIAWSGAASEPAFIQDAVELGEFDSKREEELRTAVMSATYEPDTATRNRFRATAFRLLSEARQSAARRARGYRQLVEVLKLESREFVQNIGMVIEIRTAARQPTISPLSLVTMECRSDSLKGSAPTLRFTQRKRECNEFGVCRVESIAEVKDQREYQAVFKQLQSNGRKFLDECSLNTKMLIDGEEITRVLPGLFTSHMAPVVN